MKDLGFRDVWGFNRSQLMPTTESPLLLREFFRVESAGTNRGKPREFPKTKTPGLKPKVLKNTTRISAWNPRS